jgi:hypothetical protein
MHDDQAALDYKPYFSEIIKKLIIILGPDITFSKLLTIPEITVTNDGIVSEIIENKDTVIKKFKDTFSELSPGLVKTILEPSLSTMGHQSYSTQASGVPGISV